MTCMPGDGTASPQQPLDDIWEPRPYFRVRTRIAPSRLPGAGLGAFSLQSVTRGTFLGIDLPQISWMISPQDALQLPRRERIQSWRHVEDICFRGGLGIDTPANYLNHSFEPNVLWHLGCYWACQDMEPEDEMLLDYRPLIDPMWNGRIVDAASGLRLTGDEGKRALLQSARALVDLLQDVLDDPPPSADLGGP